MSKIEKVPTNCLGTLENHKITSSPTFVNYDSCSEEPTCSCVDATTDDTENMHLDLRRTSIKHDLLSFVSDATTVISVDVIT